MKFEKVRGCVHGRRAYGYFEMTGRVTYVPMKNTNSHAGRTSFLFGGLQRQTERRHAKNIPLGGVITEQLFLVLASHTHAEMKI